ncbi:MAG: phosphatase PAP2 family protein [Ekhidna sp.]|nr:phosphatase PAP2 family protein [Ekhidna sp.]
MINRLKNTSEFFISYFVLLLLGFSYYLYQDHGDFVVLLNSLHNPIWDFWFKYWTYTGTVPFFIVTVLAVIFYKRRSGIILGLVGILIAAVTFFFKRVLFEQTPRPRVFFEGQRILEFVEGVDVLSLYSFPSGHAMAIFGLASFLALMYQNRINSFLLIIGATLTGISRIYLAQHFLIDVMAGSLIGLIIATSCYMAFEKYINHENDPPSSTPDEDLAALDLDKESFS